MKTYFAIPLMIAVTVGLISTAGCVSQVEYDKAQSLCRRANEQLAAAEAALKDSESQQAKLSAELASGDQGVLAKQKEIGLLEAKNRSLQDALTKLKALYEKTRDEDVPVPIGIAILPKQVDTALQSFATENPEIVEYLPGYGMVKFKADFTFEPGKDNISADAVKALGKLVEILNSDAAVEFHVYIAGHTDDQPIVHSARRHPTNWYLSVHRAVEVQKELAQAGLAPERIAALGFGEYHPIEPNAEGKKGNSKNRRVEVWIVPPDKLLTQTPAE